jgi:hypothetical protein
VSDIFADEGKHKNGKAILVYLDGNPNRIFSANGKIKINLPPKSISILQDGYALD